MKYFFFFSFFCFNIFSNQNAQVLEFFKKSTRYQLWNLKNQEINSAKKTQLAWLPLRLDTSLYRNNPFYGDKNEQLQLAGAVQETSDVLSLDLVYRDFSSLTNTFGIDYSRNEYDTAYSTLSNARSYDISNRLEYNLTNSAGNSDLRINQNLELVNLHLTELQAIKSLNSEYLDFFQKLLSFYLLDCKLKNQQQLKTLVDDALKKGQTLLSINVISKKDFLNYENLQIELERNLAQLNNDFLQARYDAESLGIDIDKDIDTKTFSTICQSANQIDFKVKNDDLRKNLDYEILQKQVELNTLQIKNAKRDLISDVKPFVELGMSSSLNQDSKDYRIVAGISVGWDVPNSRQQSTLKYRNFSKAYTQGDYQLTKRKVDFEAKSLSQDLNYLSQMLEITRKNLKSNEELLKILRLENSLRKGDSLNFVNTVNSRLSLINNFFDLVLQSEVKLTQFALLKDGRLLIK